MVSSVSQSVSYFPVRWSVESTHKENLRDFERDNAFELGRREALLSLHAHVGEYVRSGAVKW